MATAKPPILSAIVLRTSQASVAAFVALRLYAALFTVHVVTWDDRWFRRSAAQALPGTSLFDALRAVLLPNPANVDGERSIGYQSWLLLGAKAMPGVEPELAWHLMNIAFLGIQVGLVHVLARRASGRRDFAWLFTFLYLASPLVFGMNRWLMTENHVMTCLLALSTSALLLLDGYRAPSGRGIASTQIRWKTDLAWPAACAYVFGLCSTLREYALPSFAALSLAVILGLLVQRRRLGAAVFAAVLAPFIAAMTVALPPVMRTVLAKSGVRLYYHPMSSWIPHFIVFVAGAAFTILLTQLVGRVARAASREIRRRGRARRLDALALLTLAHLGAFTAYCAMIAYSANRVIRPGIPPLLTLICGVLIAVRWLGPAAREATQVTRTRAALIPLAWGWMIFELFFAFGGGSAYKMYPYPLERYNHPLFLRPLRDGEDMHVLPSKPYWEQDPSDVPLDPYGWF